MSVLTRRDTLKFALATLACGCHGPLTLQGKPLEPTVPHDLTAANAEFASRLYRQIASEHGDPRTNLLFSPYSVSSALAMTLVGARNGTADQMQSVLQLTPPLAEAHCGFGELNRWFNRAGKEYELTVSNALWGERTVEFAREFLQDLATHYKAPLTPVDFQQQPEKSREVINDAIEAATGNKIRDLLPSGSITTLTRLVLTNAIYFKGLWQNQFSAGSTKDGLFHVATGDPVTVPMMHQREEYEYAEAMDGRLQLTALPYRGNNLRMILLLPRDDQTLAEVEQSMSAERLKGWTSALVRQSVMLRLPRFKYEFAVSLKPTLMAMGMSLPFSDEADFAGMASVANTQGFYLSDVVHKAFVEVNEEGTEAAAATGVIVAARAMPDHAVFSCDRPFLFIIQDQKTQTALMMGKVTDPTKS
jgi:serpin B